MTQERRPIDLPNGADLAALQRYIEKLEAAKGWTEVDLVRTCLYMGEELGELFKAIRKVEGALRRGESIEPLHTEVAHELVDILNYLLAVANRLDIDLEAAFREKNAINEDRRWG